MGQILVDNTVPEDLAATVKQTCLSRVMCPVCNEKLPVGIERRVLENARQFPYAHVLLHGNPIHALIVYIDANMKVRSYEASESVEVRRDATTFSQIMKKWSNPF
jgi:hypothetical protein